MEGSPLLCLWLHDSQWPRHGPVSVSIDKRHTQQLQCVTQERRSSEVRDTLQCGRRVTWMCSLSEESQAQSLGPQRMALSEGRERMASGQCRAEGLQQSLGTVGIQ